jgi:hypothetical protein
MLKLAIEPRTIQHACFEHHESFVPCIPRFLKQLCATIKTWVLHSYVYIPEMGVHILTLPYVSYKAKKN